MKKITLRRIVSVSLVGMMLFVSAGTPWGKIPVIFAANSSITSPTAPQLTLLDDKLVLQTDLSGNSIANGGDILRLEVAINNQDDFVAADACASSGTSVTADLSKYVSIYSYGNPSSVGLTQ